MKHLKRYNLPSSSNGNLLFDWRKKYKSMTPYLIDIRTGYTTSSTEQNVDKDPEYKFHASCRIATLVIIDSKCPDSDYDWFRTEVNEEFPKIAWTLWNEITSPYGASMIDTSIYQSNLNCEIQCLRLKPNFQ